MRPLTLARLLPLLVLPLAASCGAPPVAKPPSAAAGDAGAPADAALAAPPPVEEAPHVEDDLRLPIRATDPTWGNRRAYVTIVEFADLQCPFCARAAATLKALEKAYGPDDLRIVWKHQPLPFHTHARAAAEAAQGVFALGGNDAFWAFADAAWRDQEHLSDESYDRWAAAAGIDLARLHAGLAAHTWGPLVDANHSLAQEVGVSGTPAFFINGVPLAGAQPEQAFRELIDRELAKAKEREKGGTPRDRLYAVLSAEALASVKPLVKDGRDDTTTVWRVPLDHAPMRGPATALVTIVEFGDFQCPFTKRVQETLRQVLTTYGDKVRILWRDEPLPNHLRAEPAAELAHEARAQKGDSAFWTVHDAIFASQASLADADLERIAKEAGLDVKKAMAAVKSHKHRAVIDQSADVVDDLEAKGTPHFFLNGRRLVGAQSFEKFQWIIEDELAHARDQLAKGTAPAALYDTLVKDGKGATEPTRKVVPIPAGAPSRGAADAPVVIQEFGDFQCPYCARAEATLRQIAREYPGKVRLVWRDLPLASHPHARLGAEAGRAVVAQRGMEGFWKMHDRFFAEPFDADGLTREALDAYAGEAKLDMTKWSAALDGHTYEPTVNADVIAATNASIPATPTFLIGEYELAGAHPYPKFRKLIERVLRERKGQRASAAGVVSARWEPREEPAPVPTASAAATLGVKDVVVGTGAEARAGSKVVVHYVGTFPDGKEFDSSRKRGKPFEFPLGGGVVIKGWDQGLLGMRVGGKRILTIPSALGYGEQGMGPIPPNATLVFEVELLEVK